MTTLPDPKLIRAHLERDFGSQSGWVWVAGKHRNSTEQRLDYQKPFKWPLQRDTIVRTITDLAVDHHVWAPTALLRDKAKGRNGSNVVPSNIARFEIDTGLPPTKLEWLAEHGRLTRSGRPEHFHYRLFLDEAQDAHTIAAVSRAVARHVGVSGHADSGGKFNPHDLLRIEGTINHKTGALVQEHSKEPQHKVSLEALRSTLGDFDAHDESTDAIDADAIQWDDMPASIRARIEHDDDDSDESGRGRRHLSFVNDLRKEVDKGRLTREQAKYISVHYYVPIQSKWPARQRAEDFDRCWKKEPPESNRPAKKGKTQVATANNSDNNTDSPFAALFEIETAEVEMELTRWLWDEPHRIPLGELTLIASFEGSKKSMVCVEIAARITRGELQGEYFGTPKAVIYLADEDSWNKTVVPRLAAAGADRSKVMHFKPAEDGGRGLDLSDTEHLAELRRIVEEHDVALIVFDPIISSLGGKVVEKEEPLREALTPVIHMAQDVNVSLLGIKHFTKMDHTDPSVLMGGVRTWSAIARAYIAVAPHPDDVNEPNPRMVLGIHKCNLTPDRGASIYEARQKTLRIEDLDVDVPYVGWLGDSPWTPRQALEEVANRRKQSTKSKERRVTAYSWLMQYLIDAEYGQVLRSKVIDDHNKERGDEAFSDRALDKAWQKIRDEGNAGDRKIKDKEAYWSLAQGVVFIP